MSDHRHQLQEAKLMWTAHNGTSKQTNIYNVMYCLTPILIYYEDMYQTVVVIDKDNGMTSMAIDIIIRLDLRTPAIVTDCKDFAETDTDCDKDKLIKIFIMLLQ